MTKLSCLSMMMMVLWCCGNCMVLVDCYRPGYRTKLTTSKLLERSRRRSIHLRDTMMDEHKDMTKPTSSVVSRTSLQLPIVSDAAILSLVPIIWGAYSPVVKGLYSAPNVVAPPPLVFNLLSYLVSLTALTIARYWTTTQIIEDDNVAKSSNDLNSMQNITPGMEWRGGVELGLWLFLGSTVQITGIQSTTAISAAILVQTTTILVPLLDTLFVTRKPISSKLWISCIVALIGVIIVSSGGTTAVNSDSNIDMITSTITNANNLDTIAISCSSNPWSCAMNNVVHVFTSLPSIHMNTGDMLILLSAIFYSMHVIRLGTYANQVHPVKLAQIKSFTELCASFAAIGAVFLYGNGEQITNYLQIAWDNAFFAGQGYVALAIIWNGFFSTALTTWAQSVGQRSVPPTTANLLYSSQPIWAALFSFSFLGESIGSNTVFGSGLLLGAIVYSLYEPQKPSANSISTINDQNNSQQ